MTIRTKTVLMVTGVLTVAVVAIASTLAWSSRRALLAETEAQGLVIARLLAQGAAFGTQVMRDVETAIGEQMVVEATMAAHLVAVAEAAGLPPAAITGRLRRIVDETVLNEIWITDERGHAYLTSTPDVDFTFSADPVQQPQAHMFWPLLTGATRTVVQEARERELDRQVYKYVGVAGVDTARIVQVGYHATFLEQLERQVGLSRLIDQLVAGGTEITIRVLDRDLRTVDSSGTAGRAGPGGRAPVDPATLRALIDDRRPAAVLQDAVLTVMAPIGDEGGALGGGVILVELPTDHVRSAIRAQARWAAVASTVVLLFGSVIALVASGTVTRPISRLTQLTKRIAGGDLAQTIEIRGASELRTLAASFNEMSRRLRESMEDLTRTTAAKERIESELMVAREIQMSLLPQVDPVCRDRTTLDIHAALLPAKQVGGDFYDFFFIDDRRLCLVIGDVSDKGVPAALFMAITKTLLRADAGGIRTPDELLARLNRELCRDNDSCMFVTLFCGILDTRTGGLTYSNGGHTLPYHLSGDGVSTLENVGGMALGVSEQASYRSEGAALSPGDGLLFYTDGVTDAVNAAGEFFSERRLEAFLAARRDAPAPALVQDLLDDIEDHSRGTAQFDDVTAFALRYHGPPATIVELRLTNALSEIGRVHEDLAAFGSRHGLAPRVVHDARLALEEILTNTISYGYEDDREHEIVVTLRLTDLDLEIEIRDDGRAFNPLDAPEPDVTLALDERPLGGLGIYLTRRLMDRIEYARRDQTNVFIMRKPVEASRQ